jgi:hypothetical protein
MGWECGMLSTALGPIKADRKILRARWQRDADGSLVCRWGPEHLAVSVAPVSPFRLTGRQRLPARSAALHALTAALEDPPTAA